MFVTFGFVIFVNIVFASDNNRCVDESEDFFISERLNKSAAYMEFCPCACVKRPCFSSTCQMDKLRQTIQMTIRSLDTTFHLMLGYINV